MNELKQAVQFLRNAAPEEFDVFVQFFDKYAYDATLAVTNADAGSIMTVKGQAQQALALQRLFHDCRENK